MGVTEKALVFWNPVSILFHSINCSAKINLIYSSSLSCAENISKQKSSIEILFYLYSSPITTEFNNSYKSGFAFMMKIFHFPIIVSYEKEKWIGCVFLELYDVFFFSEYYDNIYISSSYIILQTYVFNRCIYFP